MFKFFMNIEIDLRYYYSQFQEFLSKTLSTLLKFVKTVNNSVVDLIFKDTKNIVDYID